MFNTNGYSVTTEKHKGHVRSAISGQTVVNIAGCDMANAQQQMDDNLKEIEDRKGKLSRARLDHMKEHHLNRIGDLCEENKAIFKLQGVKE